MYGQAGNLYNQMTQGQIDQIPGAVDNMNQVRDQTSPYWQNQMQGGAYSGMDLQRQYNNALQDGGGNEQFVNEQIMGGQGNDYADAMKGQIMGNSQSLIDQTLASTDARAVASGMSGSSRQGTMQGNAISNIQNDANNQLTNIGYNSFDKNLDRMSGIAKRADQYDMDRLNNLSGMLGQQQNTMNQGIAGASGQQDLSMGAFSPYNAPYQGLGQYADALGRPTVLSNSTSTMEQSSGGGGKGLLGTVGGIAGGVFGGPTGAAAGSAIGGAMD